MPNENAPEAHASDNHVVELEKKLKGEGEKHAFQKKRADSLEKALAAALTISEQRQAEIDRLRSVVEIAASSAVLPQGDVVILNGETHDVVGTFRADNTFMPVKQGYCDEGVTLVAIGKPH